MSITSLTFLAFVALAVGLYYAAPRRYRWVALLLASAAYYLICDFRLAGWFVLTSLSIWGCGLLIGRQEAAYQRRLSAGEGLDREARRALKKKNARTKTAYAWLAAAFNLAIWFAFKFTDLIIAAVNRRFSASFSLLGLALPLGISFYTFQAISYVVDVSKGKCPVQRNYFKLALWLGFFPQMLQGPFCRYSETAEQLYTPHDLQYENLRSGAQLMLWGYFKKMVIADRAAQIVQTVFGQPAQYRGAALVIGALAYAFQLYGDFSGGIDIMTGAAEMLGIHLPVNFTRPFFSLSVAEYWRRWHITLGAWFRDYVFYPLSMSKAAQRVGKKTRAWFGAQTGKLLPTCAVTLIVWTMNGIWHGTGRRFAVYGFYQGLLMSLGILAAPLTARLIRRLRINPGSFSWKLWQGVRTFTLMLFGRVLYKAPSVMEALRMWRSMIVDFDLRSIAGSGLYSLGLDAHELFILLMALLVLLGVSILQERGVRIREAVARQNLVFRWLLYLAALFAVILFGAYGEGYHPSEFVYAQF